MSEYWQDLLHTGTFPGYNSRREDCNAMQKVWFSMQRLYEALKAQYFETLKHVEIVATNGWGTGAKDAMQKIHRLKDHIVEIFGPTFFSSSAVSEEEGAQIISLKFAQRRHIWDEVCQMLFSHSWEECNRKERRVAFHVEVETSGDYKAAVKLAKEYLGDAPHLDVEKLTDELKAVSLYGESWKVRGHHQMSHLTPTGSRLSDLVEDTTDKIINES